MTDPAALPFPETPGFVGLATHPGVERRPHTALRSGAVLRPEGRWCCPASILSACGACASTGRTCVPSWVSPGAAVSVVFALCGRFHGHWWLRDWLRLLSFEVEATRLGVYQPAARTERWLQRFGWLSPWAPAGGLFLGPCIFVAVNGCRTPVCWAPPGNPIEAWARRARPCRWSKRVHLACKARRHPIPYPRERQRILNKVVITPMVPARATQAQAAGRLAQSGAHERELCGGEAEPPTTAWN